MWRSIYTFGNLHISKKHNFDNKIKFIHLLFYYCFIIFLKYLFAGSLRKSILFYFQVDIRYRKSVTCVTPEKAMPMGFSDKVVTIEWMSSVAGQAVTHDLNKLVSFHVRIWQSVERFKDFHRSIWRYLMAYISNIARALDSTILRSIKYVWAKWFIDYLKHESRLRTTVFPQFIRNSKRLKSKY